MSRFVGAIPSPSANIAARWVKYHGFQSVQVICSGSFKIEAAIRELCPDIEVYANDVCLMSCILGDMYTGDDTGGIEFQDSMEMLNEAKSRGVAACILYNTLSWYRERFIVNEENLRKIVEVADRRYDDMIEKRDNLRLDAFHKRDLMDLAFDSDAEAVIGFTPYLKGGYEKMWALLEQNIEWTKPKYEMFDPSELREKLCKPLSRSGRPWMIVSDQRFEDVPMIAFDRLAGNKAVYLYGLPKFPTISYGPLSEQHPLFMDAIDPDAIRADSVIDIRSIDGFSARQIIMCYNKHWKPDQVKGLQGFVVTIDGQGAGFFGFHLMKSGWEKLWLYLDLSFVNKRRLSKLIPMLALSSEVQRYIRYAYLRRYTGVVTAALTNKPRSMKYRGTGFKLTNRKPGNLSYTATFRKDTAQEIFSEWFRKHAHKDR